MAYPEIPQNRMIVNGEDLTYKYGMILLDGWEIIPPEPKTTYIDIPGNSGTLDLTEALYGYVLYSDTEATFTFAILYPTEIPQTKADILRFLHGKSVSIQITTDPDYVYHGRTTISSISSNDDVMFVQIKVVLDPYKLKEDKTYMINGYGGSLFRFPSGTKPVKPTIECTAPIYVTWNDVEYIVPAGTHKLNNVVFQSGDNFLYINSFRVYSTKWNDVSTDTWDSMSGYRWDEAQMITEDRSEILIKSWRDISNKRWSELSGKLWSELNNTQVVVPGSEIVYLNYEWEDLVG